MQGSEKEVAWAERIVSEARQGVKSHLEILREKIEKAKAKVAANPDQQSSKDILSDYENRLKEAEFYAPHVDKVLREVESAKDVIDLRVLLERLSDGGLNNKRYVWSVLRYIGDLNEIPDWNDGSPTTYNYFWIQIGKADDVKYVNNSVSAEVFRRDR